MITQFPIFFQLKALLSPPVMVFWLAALAQLHSHHSLMVDDVLHCIDLQLHTAIC